MQAKASYYRAAAGLALAAALSGQAVAADGAAIFHTECRPCHQEGGVGAPGLAPPLASPVLKNAAVKNAAYAPLVVLNGLSGHIPLSDGSSIAGIMPPFNIRFTDEEVAAVVEYVYGTLNEAKFPIKVEDIKRLRNEKPTAKDLRNMREAFLP
jgi:nitrite reductase (NO-forming)